MRNDEEWEGLTPPVEEIRVVGDRVLVIGALRARARLTGISVESLWAQVISIGDGKLAGVQDHFDHTTALAAVRLPE